MLSYGKRGTIKLIFLLVFLLEAFDSYGQRPTENYPGRSASAQQVIVKLRTPTSAVVQALQQILHANSVRQVGGPRGPHVFHSQDLNVTVLLALLANRGEVAYAEPDYIVKTNAVPNDPSFPQLWGLHNTSTVGADISAEPAWDVSTGSTANVTGVVDTGIEYTHPDLAANVWSAPKSFTVTLSAGPITCPAGSHGYNAILNTCDPKDDNGHGSHVSGTLGAVGNNGVGVTGVNWQTQL